MVTVNDAALVVAGNWMKSANAKGHYVAAVVLTLVALLTLPRGVNGEALLALGFLTLIIADIRKLRASSDISLTVKNYRLADFWPTPWLVTGACVALLGHGAGDRLQCPYRPERKSHRRRGLLRLSI